MSASRASSSEVPRSTLGAGRGWGRGVRALGGGGHTRGGHRREQQGLRETRHSAVQKDERERKLPSTASNAATRCSAPEASPGAARLQRLHLVEGGRHRRPLLRVVLQLLQLAVLVVQHLRYGHRCTAHRHDVHSCWKRAGTERERQWHEQQGLACRLVELKAPRRPSRYQLLSTSCGSGKHGSMCCRRTWHDGGEQRLEERSTALACSISRSEGVGGLYSSSHSQRLKVSRGARKLRGRGVAGAC